MLVSMSTSRGRHVRRAGEGVVAARESSTATGTTSSGRGDSRGFLEHSECEGDDDSSGNGDDEGMAPKTHLC